MSDALTEALSALEVRGTVVLHHAYATPWALEVPSSDALGPLVGAEPSARTVAFHWAERGGFTLRADGATRDVTEGEVVVCFGGARHRMSRGRRSRAVDLRELLGGARALEPGDPERGATQLVCGVFVLRNPRLNPLIASLPPVLHARALDPALRPAASILRAELTGGPASGFILDRALEIFCAGLIRERLGDSPDGLLGSLTDPRLSRALASMHREPSAPWTVEARSSTTSSPGSRRSASARSRPRCGPSARRTA